MNNNCFTIITDSGCTVYVDLTFGIVTSDKQYTLPKNDSAIFSAFISEYLPGSDRIIITKDKLYSVLGSENDGAPSTTSRVNTAFKRFKDQLTQLGLADRLVVETPPGGHTRVMRLCGCRIEFGDMAAETAVSESAAGSGAYYLNGDLSSYGCHFGDTVHERFRMDYSEDSRLWTIEAELEDGDLFKLSKQHWQAQLGGEALETADGRFEASDDSYGGTNIRCNLGGYYRISSDGVSVRIEYLSSAPDSETVSLWQLAGELGKYPQNNWGSGSEHIFLHKAKLGADSEFSNHLYDCFALEDVELCVGDELKFAVIDTSGSWESALGADLLHFVKPSECDEKLPDMFYTAEPDDLSHGINIGTGANIRVMRGGCYIFNLYIPKKYIKEGVKKPIITWKRCYRHRV